MNYSKQFLKLNPSDMLINETDYYNWLYDNYKDRYIDNTVEYLSDRFGFKKGIDKVDHEIVQTMTYFHKVFFTNERLERLEQ